MDRSYPNLVVGLIFIFGLLYIFSPQSNLIGTPETATADSVHIHTLEIRSGGILDPRQADLRVRTGDKETLIVITDQDGRVDLKGAFRSTFNPIFSGTTNSLTIPTDQAGSYQIQFHPNASPDNETEGTVLGTIVVEK